MKDLPVRKNARLKGYNYNSGGSYYIAFCVKDRHNILGMVVGRGILDAPQSDILDVPCVQLSKYGKYVVESIEFLNSKNDCIIIDKYVVMPNHVHLIIIVGRGILDAPQNTTENGASGKPRPTNAVIPKYISSIKRYVDKRAGFAMWQRSYHDHIIRNKDEYRRIWQYIDENPARWEEDVYYCRARHP